MRLLSAVTGAAGVALLIVACSSSSGSSSGDLPDGSTGTLPDGAPINPGDSASNEDGSGPGNPEGGTDAGTDGSTDAAFDGPDDSGVVDPPPGQPGILGIGRFDTSDPNNLKFGWPGTSIIARFDGTDASVTLSQTNGFSGGPSYFNVLVDDVLGTPFSVTGTQTIVLASGLAAGTHKVEIQKRTEANLGVITFSGFTFAGGAGLLEPPPRQTKRIEWLTDSTMDGFGIDGDRINDAAGCTKPHASKNNIRESIAWLTSSALDAEMFAMSYSGKGVARNENGAGGDLFATLYGRTIPDNAGAWNFANFPPDVVVIAVGGSDCANTNPTTLPANFQANYDALVGTVRTNYPNAYIFLTVWSQIKAYNQARPLIAPKLQSIVTTRKNGGDDRIFYYAFSPEADPSVEVGCEYHANAAHHQAMSDLLKAQIQANVPGF